MNQLNHLNLNSIYKKAASYLNQDMPNEAIKLYELSLRYNPKNEFAVSNITEIFIKYKEYENALKSCKYHLSITKKKAEVCNILGNIYYYKRDHQSAIEAYIEGMSFNPKYHENFHACCDLYIRQGKASDFAALLKGYEDAIQNTASLFWLKGRINFSLEEYEESLKYYVSAYAKKQYFNDDMLTVFLGDYSRTKVKVEAFSEAFDLMVEAKNSHSKEYEILLKEKAKDHRFIKDTMSKITNKTSLNWKNQSLNNEMIPIFVIGFPRSGTTLMEQILHSHPNLQVTDEFEVISQQTHKMSKILKKAVKYPDDLHKLSAQDIETWRKYYVNSLSESIPNFDKDKRVVDKLPMNIKYLPTIKRFFPDSPIIMMVRDPRDVCISCFMSPMRLNSLTVNFSSLDDTFSYYAKILNMYEHYKASLNLNVLEVRYEDLCSDLEGVSKVIMHHIDEPWTTQLLDFYKEENRRLVNTPSHFAIQKPINKSAIGGWQHYKEKIIKAQYLLEAFICKYGYSLE